MIERARLSFTPFSFAKRCTSSSKDISFSTNGLKITFAWATRFADHAAARDRARKATPIIKFLIKTSSLTHPRTDVNLSNGLTTRRLSQESSEVLVRILLSGLSSSVVLGLLA